MSIAPRPTDTTEQAHREAPKQPAPHICGRCPARWSGANIAHCRSCHRTFTTPANFDKHRAGLKDTGIVAGECHDPEWNGLVLNDRGHWSMPGGYH